MKDEALWTMLGVGILGPLGLMIAATHPSDLPVTDSGGVVYPVSPLDGRQMTPFSQHCGHVRFKDDIETVMLDSGVYVKFYFTGGTLPYGLRDMSGRLCYSVPEYARNTDLSGDYYFRSFTPDKPISRICPEGSVCTDQSGLMTYNSTAPVEAAKPQ